MIFVTFSAFSAGAQEMLLGARIGANLANESRDSVPSGFSNASNAGILAGLQFDYWFSDMWGLSAQALYDQKGTDENVNQTAGIVSTSASDNITLNYLEIPILLKLRFGTGRIRPYVFAGPSFGFFLSGSDTRESSSSGGVIIPTNSDTTISIPSSSVKTLDISGVFGAGLSIKLNSGHLLFLDAAYALGLVDIFNTQNGSNTMAESRDIRIAAGILFPLN